MQSIYTVGDVPAATGDTKHDLEALRTHIIKLQRQLEFSLAELEGEIKDGKTAETAVWQRNP